MKVLLFFVTLIALMSSACAQQLIVSSNTNVDKFAVFGETNIVLGQFRLTTSNEKATINSLTFKVRECSNWTTLAVPFSNYTLSTGTTVIPGIESTVDQERLVAFPVGIIRANTTVLYTLQADVKSYGEAIPLDKQCFRMALERTGIETKAQLTGNFPIRLSAETLVRSKPTVTLTPNGVTTNRARTTTDDVIKLTMVADSHYSIMMSKILIRVGNVPGNFLGTFQLVDDGTGVQVPGTFTRMYNGVVTFAPSYQEFIPQGGAKVYRIRMDSSTLPNTLGPDVVIFSLQQVWDFQWDVQGSDITAPGMGLEQFMLPIQATVSYE